MPTPTDSRENSLVFSWLLEGQIEPTFRKHPYLQRALVLAVPALWETKPLASPPAPIRMMIFYSHDAKLRLDAVVSAYTRGTQNPSLPEGVTNHDLFEPVGLVGHADKSIPMPIAMCPPSFFVGGEMDVENDDGGVLSAFFVYAQFRRSAEGVVSCEKRDRRMGERMSQFVASVIANQAGRPAPSENSSHD